MVSRVVARRQTYNGIIRTDRIATVIQYYFTSLYTVYFVLRVLCSSTCHIIIFHDRRVGIRHARFSSRQTHTHGKKHTYIPISRWCRRRWRRRRWTMTLRRSLSRVTHTPRARSLITSDES